ncbi:MAG: metallopeptidase TldD-related protein [Bacteroidales bacterium]|jgi:PmbA protein|nr:TldD/PmbA family protein [Bacteroidales bacterium]MDD2264022.1 metallopeptidase TldD-related protein [Bacteroidales bacterium]MDD2831256.1 metallopeptidase TldD-related protein [Bacteroidales bacterium]MDD3208631.1 metallopeptidase TldD-related protein [Bacteroidales bacterium]MDD3697194.1 metallopeptidase TldD-related protein [Bacteroidales bacterium]
MKEKELLEQMCGYALEMSLKKGAKQARVTAFRDVSNGLTVLNDSLERIQNAVESALMIHLFVEGRFGTCSTNRTDPAGIDKLLDDAIASVRLLAPDNCRTLVPSVLRYEGSPLYSAHRGEIGTAIKKSRVFDCVASVHGKNPSLISVTADYADYRRWVHMVDSAGLNCTSEETWYSLSAECSVRGKGDKRPSDWNYMGGIKPGAIGIGSEAPCRCAVNALERALAKRDPRKTASGKYSVIVENRVASTLLGPVIEAMSGNALQQQNSFLLNKLGERVASPVLTLTDDPHRKGNPGYRLFDSEGMATVKRTIIDAGRLNLYFLNTYYANKMKMNPTISSPSLLLLKGGHGDVASLAGLMKNGIFVTGFNGGNCNTATGDFSYGIEGFFVQDGQIAYPINEMVMTGNMTDLWNQLTAAGNDALTTSSWQIPSLLFESIEFAGI